MCLPWLRFQCGNPTLERFQAGVATGSREENASKQKDRTPLRFRRNGKSSSLGHGLFSSPGEPLKFKACRKNVRPDARLDTSRGGLDAHGRVVACGEVASRSSRYG